MRQALLDEWRAELARKPLGMSEAEACTLLEISTGPDETLDEETLKGAYRRLARKYHPDKNPTGRERFMAVQRAYERLQAGAAAGQGPQPWRLLLILKVCVAPLTVQRPAEWVSSVFLMALPMFFEASMSSFGNFDMHFMVAALLSGIVCLLVPMARPCGMPHNRAMP